MSRVLVPTVAALALLALAPSSAEARERTRWRHRDVGARIGAPAARSAVAAAVAAPTPITVYLRRGGATLTHGWDDSAAGRSELVPPGETVRVPAFAGGDRAWQRLVGCVADAYGDFAVDVVDERPASGSYILAVVGGTASLLGHGDEVSGVAPWNGEVLRDAVVYVFADELDGDDEQLCVTATHEIGHALGLDHAVRCDDPMSYLWGCGEKRFRDVDAPCGEEEARPCEDGGTQNSYRHLAAAVGLRSRDRAGDGELLPTGWNVDADQALAADEPVALDEAPPRGRRGRGGDGRARWRGTGSADDDRRRGGGRRGRPTPVAASPDELAAAVAAALDELAAALGGDLEALAREPASRARPT
ncbi:MAG: hypothetical protein R2939_13990 [Kofleriaceae bacterium]